MNTLEIVGVCLISGCAAIWGLLSAFLPSDRGGDFLQRNMMKIVLAIFAIGTVIFFIGSSQPKPPPRFSPIPTTR